MLLIWSKNMSIIYVFFSLSLCLSFYAISGFSRPQRTIKLLSNFNIFLFLLNQKISLFIYFNFKSS